MQEEGRKTCWGLKGTGRNVNIGRRDGGERQERRAVTAESLRDVSVFMAGKI